MREVPGDRLDCFYLATAVVLCLTGETFWDLDAKEIAEESVSLHSQNEPTRNDRSINAPQKVWSDFFR
jgi:hypothetical protein